MTQQINTTDAQGESAVFAVAAGTVIQVSGAKGTSAIIELQVRVDPDADWASVGSINVASRAFMVVDIAFAHAKLVWTGNKVGDPLRAWSV